MQSLDLERRHFTRDCGEVTVIGTWILTEENRYHPCLVLVRSGEERGEHTYPCIVRQDQAWIWSEEVGDPAACARTTHAFLEALRLPQTLKNHIKLASCVHDHLGDLLHIPPRLFFIDDAPSIIGELTIQANGKTIHEAELRADV